ncbi:MAG: hypothetical protein JWO72_2666 [Caulobacteraceae bacterium]|nr:hypothetical protein [Caulobacteraceae bacterium]
MAAAVLLALAGGQAARAQGAGGGCRIERKARLPLTESHGRFVTTVTVNGRPLRMLVDTGAQRAALSPAMADRLRLPRDPGQTFRATGVGGRGREEHPRIAGSVAFGPATWRRYALQTAAIVRPEQAGDPAAPVGLIGADMLSAYDVEFDFPGRILTLYAVSGCTGRFVPWKGRYDAFPAEPAPADLFVIPVSLEGHRLRALLDTGSNTSSLGRAAARTAGVDDARLRGDKADSYLGSKGAAVAARRHRFGAFSIGDTLFKNAPIAVRAADFGVFDMLLGVDFLRSRKVWLSYGTRQVFIQSPASTPGR